MIEAKLVKSGSDVNSAMSITFFFFTFFNNISTFSRNRKAFHQSVVDPCRIEIFRYGQNHTRGVDYFGLELEFNTDWASGAEVD